MENLEEKEIWKDIEGYENLYQVSNLGRVKSLGNGKSRKEKILKPRKQSNGYLTVILCKEGEGKNYLVHRLVAQAFIPNPLNLPQVNHTTEDKTMNAVECLEWCTAEYNNSYATRNVRISKANINGKLSKKVRQYSLEGEFIKEFPSASEIQRQLGFANNNISSCCLGKRKTSNGYIWKYA